MSRCFYKYDVFRFRKYYQPGPDAELEFGFEDDSSARTRNMHLNADISINIQ